MPLVKHCRIVEDRFVRLADDAPLPDNGPIIVSAERFLAERSYFACRVAPTGVAWPNDRPVAELADCLDSADLVALVFPTFRDGRAYSQARLLRERHGYRGELRATGEVLRDQFLFLQRAGFDSFEVKKPADAAVFEENIGRYDVFYQPAADGRAAAAQARRNHVPKPATCKSFGDFIPDDRDALTRS